MVGMLESQFRMVAIEPLVKIVNHDVLRNSAKLSNGSGHCIMRKGPRCASALEVVHQDCCLRYAGHYHDAISNSWHAKVQCCFVTLIDNKNQIKLSRNLLVGRSQRDAARMAPVICGHAFLHVNLAQMLLVNT